MSPQEEAPPADPGARPTGDRPVALLAAVAANGVIGRDNDLPWYLPPDLRRFKELTLGHAMVMGRRTFDSIGKPLPGRPTVVLTRSPDFAAPDVLVARTLPAALQAAARAAPGEVFVVGGEDVFREALPLADRMYLTRIEAEFEGDTRFPSFDPAEWRLVSEERHGVSAEAAYPFRFEVWERAREGAI